MLRRGRPIFRQYTKNKRHNYDIKFFELCQYDGIIFRVSIYSRQSYNDDINLGQTGAIVLQLAYDFLKKRYSLFVDYYSSFELATNIAKRSTYTCGTLRSDRKSNPHVMTKTKLKKGEFTWRGSGNVVVCKLKDKRDVLTISNKHINPKTVSVTNRRGDQK